MLNFRTLGLWGSLLLMGIGTAGAEQAPQPPAAAQSAVKTSPAANRFSKDGVTVEFSVDNGNKERKELWEGDYADVTFRFTDASGQPVKSLNPSGWMDIGKVIQGKDGETPKECKEKIGLYLKGIVGIRPMLDLNSYFIAVLNKDASISIIDPFVGMTGKTNLYASIVLPRPGADWIKSRDQKRLYVTMPKAKQVAVVDTDQFKVIANINAGENPTRIALQPDEKYIWVANDASQDKMGSVTVIDRDTQKVVGEIPTGRGHHEIAFSSDDRYAYVSNRLDATVSVVDIATLKKIKDVKTGGVPISLGFSSLSQALYVVDGQGGVVAVVDGRTHEVSSRIAAKPGMGPMRFTPDGRWALVVNPKENVVHVVDASSNRLAHNVPVPGQPYQLSLTRGFAHVRSLESERVSMINLNELGKAEVPSPNSFAVGAVPPVQVPDLGIADVIKPASPEAAVLVVNAGEGSIAYYMEGMNATSGSFRSYGHEPRAVEVVDRSLKERAPGVYSTKVRIPTAGTYDVALLVGSPRISHCFNVEAKANPLVKHEKPVFETEYLMDDHRVAVGDTVPVRFRILDPETRKPTTGLQDVRVLSYRAPSFERTESSAKEIEPGVYQVSVPIRDAGAYYIYVAAPSLKLKFNDMPFLSLRAMEKPSNSKAAQRQGG